MKDKIFNLNDYIDFTLLDPRATIFDLQKLCNIAYKNSINHQLWSFIPALQYLVHPSLLPTKG